MKNLYFLITFFTFLSCQVEEPEPQIITEYVEVIRTDTVFINDTVYYADTIFVTETEVDTVLITDTLYITQTIYLPENPPNPGPFVRNPWEMEMDDISCAPDETEYYPLFGSYVYDFDIEYDPYYGYDMNPVYFLTRYRIYNDPFIDEHKLTITREEVDNRSGHTITVRETRRDFIINGIDDNKIIYAEGDRLVEFATVVCLDEKVLELSFPEGEVLKLLNEEYLREE